MDDIDSQFSDSETCVRLDVDVNGCDAFLFQALLDPASGRSVDQNYMAFHIATRTLRELGAAHVTAVLPYLAYARQDKPSKSRREPTTAKLLADLTAAAGIDRLVTWHPHTGRIRGFYGSMPVHALDSLSLFTREFDRFRGRDDVIVIAPDAGASKSVTYFGRALNLRCTIASKHRPRPEEAVISEIIGDFEGKHIAIVLDDMISSGGTLHALVTNLIARTDIREVHVGASHNLCMRRAWERLFDLQSRYHLMGVVVTSSIPQTARFLEVPFFSVRCLSDTLARVINRIHYGRSVDELFGPILANER
jgi:ribose-phosphate pyrophosphokinase